MTFIGDLLNKRLPATEKFKSRNYEFLIFDRISDLVSEIQRKNQDYGLARLVAGYAWPWDSRKDPAKYDIEIDDVRLRWNRTNDDWINILGAEMEVGCIHTTQGYDLNYTGVIFGHEIGYDKRLDQIVIYKDNYYDKTGKLGIDDPEELKQYILNIYRTIMLRGIKGTFVYACDSDLRDYLKQHIPVFRNDAAVIDFPKPVETKIPYVNSVPLYDLQAAAGSFSDFQHVEHENWVVMPENIHIQKDMFACRVVGESMNRVIPDGAICLFRFSPGGSRNGKIVLVECADIQDGDGGSRYTVKEYQSIKTTTDEEWEHRRIFLKPRSYNSDIAILELNADDEHRYRVVGEFLRVIK